MSRDLSACIERRRLDDERRPEVHDRGIRFHKSKRRRSPRSAIARLRARARTACRKTTHRPSAQEKPVLILLSSRGNARRCVQVPRSR
jgi:hypothetical protein